MTLEFLLPHRLWWMLSVLIIGALYLWLSNRMPRTRKSSSKLSLVLPKEAAWKRHLAVGAALLAIASLVVAYAKPKDLSLIHI